MPAGGDAAVTFRFHVHPDVERSGPGVVCENPGPAGACSNFVAVPGGCAADADCSRTVADEYVARVAVTISSDQVPVSPRPAQTIALEVDLNSSNPASPTATFVEGFEAGLVNFLFQTLDADKASNALSDGYRCQYNDPDYVHSWSYGDSECYLGFTFGQDPVNDWHVHDATAPDGGRAFAGSRALHYGKHTAGHPGLDTYGLRQLDAIRTKSSVSLAARTCRDDPSPTKRACATVADCEVAGGGPCVAANPELSFKHQVSLVDDRILGPDNETTDRAIVQVQVSGSATWQKVTPFENTYDVVGTNNYANCLFDPIDDGNDEDSYFDPSDPLRRFGPSSTCFPEFVFSYLGDTERAYDPARIGKASDGPGLEGSLGPGTWVESKFDLSAYRGRSVRLRFLLTSFQIGPVLTTWASTGLGPGSPLDDGWYVDDLRVTRSLGVASSTVSLDTADNSALPGNVDGDARGDDCDCAPVDAGAYADPSEIHGVVFGTAKSILSWQSAAPAAGSGTVHDVLRGTLGELPVGAGGSEVCIEPGVLAATTVDPTTPVEGTGFWYLVRGRNSCSAGTYGVRSDGTERVSLACP
jgi:hypothetical protein